MRSSNTTTLFPVELFRDLNAHICTKELCAKESIKNCVDVMKFDYLCLNHSIQVVICTKFVCSHLNWRAKLAKLSVNVVQHIVGMYTYFLLQSGWFILYNKSRTWTAAEFKFAHHVWSSTHSPGCRKELVIDGGKNLAIRLVGCRSRQIPKISSTFRSIYGITGSYPWQNPDFT